MPSPHQEKCEAEFGTTHLPQPTRDAIYAAARAKSAAVNEPQVRNAYDDFAHVALMAYVAGLAKGRADERGVVCAYIKSWLAWSIKTYRSFCADLAKDRPL